MFFSYKISLTTEFNLCAAHGIFIIDVSLSIAEEMFAALSVQNPKTYLVSEMCIEGSNSNLIISVLLYF